MNSEAIYDVCKSATLITSFNHLGMCTSYGEPMRFQSDTASCTVEGSEGTVPFPNHFNRTMFTMGAFDNFDHDETTLSGIGGSHDTVTALFQDHGGVQERKPRISETNVNHGPKAFNTDLKCQELKEFCKPSKKADLHSCSYCRLGTINFILYCIVLYCIAQGLCRFSRTSSKTGCFG